MDYQTPTKITGDVPESPYYTKNKKYSFQQKWTSAIEKHGYTDVPNILLQCRKQLKITTPELVTLAAVLSFKWDERNPWPSMRLISQRAGCTPRTARKHLESLEDKGLPLRVARTYQSNEYNFTVLIEKLDKLAKANPTIGQDRSLSTVSNDMGDRSVLTTKEDSLEKDSKRKHTKTATVSADTTELNSEIRQVYDYFIKQFDKNSSLYKLTDKRKQKIKLRLKDAGYDMLIQAIGNVASNDWYRGDNEHNWKADLGYIVRSYEQVERLSQLNDKTITYKADW